MMTLTKNVSSNEGAGSFQNIALSAPSLKISPVLFARYQRLIYQETGIWLGAAKMALLAGRLSRRLRALGLETLDRYYKFVTAPGGEDEFVLMIDAITTNETHFFREPRHFDFLLGTMVPLWTREAEEGLRPKQIRIWSAGCSTGEEPYSLAMLLLKHLPGWDVQVLATDISTKVLGEAQAGVFRLQKASEIPSDLLREYMLKGAGGQEGKMKVTPEIRTVVTFQRLNLTQIPIGLGPFDCVFCRNVLIYFDTESKKQVIDDLLNRLRPAGMLFLGHSENLNGITRRVKGIAPTIYQRSEPLL